MPLDREQRAEFKAKLLLQRRPGRLSIATAQIGRIMVDMLGADGRLDPSLATLADKARVSVATVKRALLRLQACGFVTWTRRLIRNAAGGWRTEQASNAYRLIVPATEAHFAPAVVRQESKPVRIRLPEVSHEGRKAAQEALARREAVVLQMLAERRANRPDSISRSRDQRDHHR